MRIIPDGEILAGCHNSIRMMTCCNGSDRDVREERAGKEDLWVLVVAVTGLVITKVLIPAFTILHSQSFCGVGMMWGFSRQFRSPQDKAVSGFQLQEERFNF